MAIEQHPQFPEWSIALDRLNKAWEDYSTAKAFDMSGLAELESEVLAAMRHFRKLSDEIDA